MEENKEHGVVPELDNGSAADNHSSEPNGLDAVEEILEDAPEEVRHEVKKMMMSMSMGGVMSPSIELMKKLTPEHVSEFLIGQREAVNNQFKESRDSKVFLGISLVVILSFVVILVVLLKDSPDILEKVLYTLGGLITGLLGGYGFGKSRGNE